MMVLRRPQFLVFIRPASFFQRHLLLTTTQAMVCLNCFATFSQDFFHSQKRFLLSLFQNFLHSSMSPIWESDQCHFSSQLQHLVIYSLSLYQVAVILLNVTLSTLFFNFSLNLLLSFNFQPNQTILPLILELLLITILIMFLRVSFKLFCHLSIFSHLEME